MALYRFAVSIVKRSEGQSSVKRAAYNSRDNLKDEKFDRTWNFNTDHDLEWDAIFAPKDAPTWAKDRERLWNEVERYEDLHNRKSATAQTARSFIIALPHELTLEQCEWLVKDFARELVRKGMVVDVAIHEAPAKSGARHKADRIRQMMGDDWTAGGDPRNRHIHIITTMREIGAEGFGKKNREWNHREELEHWRERWAVLGSRALERAGFHKEAERFRWGHLTLKEQKRQAERRGDYGWAKKCDREPQEHMGAKAMGMEKRGTRTRKGNRNRAIHAHTIEKDYGIHVGARGLAKAADGVAKMIESLWAPTVSPQQRKRDADQAVREYRRQGIERERERD